MEWKPHPKQEIALLSECYETLYGGARGGGKTDAGQAWLLYPIDNPRYRALVIRRNFNDLNDWLDRAEIMYSGTGARIINRSEIKFPTGAKILVGHLADASAYTKYQGHEYQRLLVEELTQIPSEELYLKLISSCRSTIDIEPRIFATCNPGGVGHSWVKRRFVDPAFPMQVFKDKISGRTRIYIPATVDDNPVLMEKDPDYVKFLDSLPPDLKAQWRNGDWTEQKIKGAYWADEIDRARKDNRICNLSLLPYFPVYTAWDLGVNDIQAVWFYQLKGDQVRIIDSFSDSSKPFGFYVKLLQDKEKDLKYEYATHILPHDGTKRSPDSLRSFKDALEEAGYDVRIVQRTKDKGRDIEAARAILPRCWFDEEKCSHGLEAISQYRREWSDDRQTFLNHPYHDWASNFADAFQALAVSLPITRKMINKPVKSSFNKPRTPLHS